MTSAPAPPFSGTMDVGAFTAFLETRPSEEWWQLIEGVAMMMNSPTLAHQRIALNFRDLISDALRGSGLDLYAYVDIGVRMPGVSDFQPQPDVAVVPGLSSYESHAERFRLVAEVVSPSNTRREIELKLRHYREAPENLYAVVIEQRRIAIEFHARRQAWQPLVLTTAEAALDLPEFGLHCLVGDLYRGTPLDPRRGA